MDNLQEQKIDISQNMMKRRVCPTCGQPIGAIGGPYLPPSRPGDWDKIRSPKPELIDRFPLPGRSDLPSKMPSEIQDIQRYLEDAAREGTTHNLEVEIRERGRKLRERYGEDLQGYIKKWQARDKIFPREQLIRKFPEQPGEERNQWGDPIGTRYPQWEGPGNPAWEARKGRWLSPDGIKGYGGPMIGRQSGYERVNAPKLRQTPINTQLTNAFNSPKTKITGGNPAFTESFNDPSIKIPNTPYRQDTSLKTLKRDSLSQALGRVKMKNQYT